MLTQATSLLWKRRIRDEQQPDNDSRVGRIRLLHATGDESRARELSDHDAVGGGGVLEAIFWEPSRQTFNIPPSYEAPRPETAEAERGGEETRLRFKNASKPWETWRPFGSLRYSRELILTFSFDAGDLTCHEV